MFDNFAADCRNYGGAVIMSLLMSCAAPSEYAPVPQVMVTPVRDKHFVTSTKHLEELCQSRTRVALDGNEEQFYPYLRWLNTLGGVAFNPDYLEIVPDGDMGALMQGGFIGFFLNGGACAFDRVLVKNRAVTLSGVAHEVGHAKDPNLDELLYCVDKLGAVRMEATAQAFEHYAGVMLLRAGMDEELAQPFFVTSPMATEARGIIEYVKSCDKYESGRGIIMLLMNTHSSIDQVWNFLREHTKNEVFGAAHRVVLEKGLSRGLNEGYSLLTKERLQSFLNGLPSGTVYGRSRFGHHR